MIINVPKKNLTVSTRYIEEKLQQGKLDEAFCKLTIQGIDKKENVLNQMVVILVAIIAMLGWILCIYGIIFMIFIIFSTRRLWKEISKIWGDKN